MTAAFHSPYTHKRAIVIGAGVSGQAATRLLLALGARVTVIDEKPEAVAPAFMTFMQEKQVTFVGEAMRPDHFENCDVVVTSPGVPYTRLAKLVHAPANAMHGSHSNSAAAPHSDVAVASQPDTTAGYQSPEILAETDLALQFTKAPVIAITGTSGKTTTVSLCEAMLTAAGKKVFLGGNIGTPLSDFVLSGEQVDVIVLELSSFQLQGCQHLHARVAAILNLNPNHLDQHADMEEYTAAKFAIFNNQTNADVALLPKELFGEYQRRECKAELHELAPTMNFTLDFLQGSHNAMNAQTAYLATRIFGVDEALARSVAKKFKPLAHRLEHVGEVDGVRYINDSKSTTVDSLRVALQSFDKGIILMAGGRFKGGDLHSLVPLISEKVKAIALYGGSRAVFEEAWTGKSCDTSDGHSLPPLLWHETMDEAFVWAASQATQGDAVLLSPATSSYDQFPNYIERGKHFCRLVSQLVAQLGKRLS